MSARAHTHTHTHTHIHTHTHTHTCCTYHMLGRVSSLCGCSGFFRPCSPASLTRQIVHDTQTLTDSHRRCVCVCVWGGVVALCVWTLRWMRRGRSRETSFVYRAGLVVHTRAADPGPPPRYMTRVVYVSCRMGSRGECAQAGHADVAAPGRMRVRVGSRVRAVSCAGRPPTIIV